MRLDQLVNDGKLLEAQRLEQRTNFDLEMLEATGVCNGIENYSRYLTGRAPGEPPPTLFEFIPDKPSCLPMNPTSRPANRRHVQRRLRRKMHAGRTRVPPALMHGQPPAEVRGMGRHAPPIGLCVGTPAAWEIEQTGGVFTEQIIRPTGLIDPKIEIRPVDMQVDDLLDEVRKVAADGYAHLVTTLTKRMAEDLTEYMHEQGIRVRYMHSTSTRLNGSKSCATCALARLTC